MPTTADHEVRFHRLYVDNVAALTAYAMRRVDQPDLAADVVADTMLVAWRRIDDAPDGHEARLWLFGVARRVLANTRRGRRRRGALIERLALDIGALARTVDPPTATHQAVRDAVARLPTWEREVVELTAWEGLTPSEAARVIGIPAATARSRLRRARHTLRSRLLGDDTRTDLDTRAGVGVPPTHRQPTTEEPT